MYKTANGGKSWLEVSGGLPADSAINDIAIDSQEPNYIYARTERTLYRSIDAGNSWAQVNLHPQGEGGYVLRELALDPNQPATVYQVVCFMHLGKNEIWKSEDHGITWSCI